MNEFFDIIFIYYYYYSTYDKNNQRKSLIKFFKRIALSLDFSIFGFSTVFDVIKLFLSA